MSRIFSLTYVARQSTLHSEEMRSVESGRAGHCGSSVETADSCWPAKEVGLCPRLLFSAHHPASAPGIFQHSFPWAHKLLRLENAAERFCGRNLLPQTRSSCSPDWPWSAPKKSLSSCLHFLLVLGLQACATMPSLLYWGSVKPSQGFVCAL